MQILLTEILKATPDKAVEIAHGLFHDRRTSGSLANTQFYEGNHWQDGKGYIGAKPLTVGGCNQIMAQLKEGFVSENVIAEVVDRHVGGILGREPLWGFVPQKTTSRSASTRRKRFAKVFSLLFPDNPATAETDRFAQEADEALTVWWDQGQPRKKLKEALVKCLNEERALIRFFVPRGLYNKNTPVPTSKTLTEALKILHLDVVMCDKGGIFIDTDTRQPFGLYVYKCEEFTVCELTYVDALGRTILQVLSDNPDRRVDPIEYHLQGRLWMYEISRKQFITEQIRSTQRSLNLDLTMLVRNINLAGSLERAIMNAERPKQTVRVPDPNRENGFREETVNSDFLVGPGVTNFLTGLLIRDDEGRVIGRANPNISYRNPVPVETFVNTRTTMYESILGQAQQKHALIAGDAQASGRSREQARAEFRSSLLDTKESLDDAGRWVLETGLRLAAQFCDRVNDFKNLRCDFDSRIEDGPISPEERSANRDDVTAGLLSREAAMSRNGVEDTDAEKTRITEDKAESPAPPMLPPPTDPNNPSKELVQ